MELAFNDLKIVWKHVDRLEIHNKACDDINRRFIDFFKLEECIHPKSIHLDRFSFDDVLTMLSRFDAQTLRSIKLWPPGFICENELSERIVHLNQLKQAKEFQFACYEFDSELLSHLFHFQRFDVEHVMGISTQIAVRIRDVGEIFNVL